MTAMREHLFIHDVDRWAGSFLDALEKSEAGR
jgi:hypothetical protein